jgi:hypothetical protein
MRPGKARSEHSVGLACHLRWVTYERAAHLRPVRHTPKVGAGCGKAARPVLCGGRIAICVPTAIRIYSRSEILLSIMLAHGHVDAAFDYVVHCDVPFGFPFGYAANLMQELDDERRLIVLRRAMDAWRAPQDSRPLEIDNVDLPTTLGREIGVTEIEVRQKIVIGLRSARSSGIFRSSRIAS